jgi:hypothetical protein
MASLYGHRPEGLIAASMDDPGLLDGSVAPGKTRKEDADQCLSVRVDPLRVAGIPADKKAHRRSCDVGLDAAPTSR